MLRETATAVATIDLAALRHNARRLIQQAKPAGLMGVVKADAYGHGAVRVSEILLAEGVEWLAVATISEAASLRRHGIDCRILVMGAMQPEWARWYEEFNLDATIASKEAVEALAELPANKRRLRVHLKVDTGMGRIGIDPGETLSTVRFLEGVGGIDLVGFYTHLAAADADDLSSTRDQIERFDRSLKDVSTDDRVVHLANTEAIYRLQDSFQHYSQTLVRAGVGLYGSPVRDETREALDLRQVMMLTAAVTQVKTVTAGTPISYGGRWIAPESMVIATLGIGYADGYRRILEGKAWAGFDGARCEIVGAICMDMIMAAIKVGETKVSPGTRAVLFGNGGPHVADVAKWAQTIPYEIWTGISRRVPRIYVDADSAAIRVSS